MGMHGVCRSVQEAVSTEVQAIWRRRRRRGWAIAAHRAPPPRPVEALEPRQMLTVNVALAGTGTSIEGASYVVAASFSDTAGLPAEGWCIIWGDGHWNSGSDAPGNYCHSYSDNGSYSINAYAWNANGSASSVASVAVANSAPWVGACGASGIDEGSVYTLWTAYSDVGNDHVAGWIIEWGDGLSNSYGSDASSFTHVYSDDGNYIAHVSATDEDGTFGGSCVAVAVANVAPAVWAYGSSTVDEGSAYELSFYAGDPGDDQLSGITIAWGDGQSETVSGDPVGTYTHVYDRPGNYSIVASTADEDGGPYAASVAVAVSQVTPYVGADGSSTVDEGSSYQLTLAYADPAGDELLGWTIEWGDYSNDAFCGWATNACHVYADNGTYTAIVTAADEDGSYSSSVTINVQNVAPTLSLFAPGGADEGSSYAFTASHIDPGADNLCGWTVDWGDGCSADPFSSGYCSFTHVYDVPGNYCVTLSAYDEDGGPYTAVHGVAVGANSKTLGLYGPSSSAEACGVSFCAAFYDPSCDAISSWAIDFGDGQSSSGTGAWQSNFDHAYSDDGNYAVSLVVWDDDGNSHACSTSIQVDNVDPWVYAGASSTVDEGSTFTLDLGYSDVGDDHVSGYVVHWGDGSSDSVSPGLGGSTSVSHVYDAPGSQCLVVDAIDDDGTWSSAQAVWVHDVSGTAWASGPSSAVAEGSAYYLNVGYSAAPGDALSGWTVDWGDGNTDNGDANSNWFNHAYSDDGQYTVTATANDDDGATNVCSLNIAIANVDPFVGVLGRDYPIEGQSAQFNLLYADPGDDDLNGWTIDWGDGKTGTADAAVTQVSHVYDDPGQYLITATANAEDGSFDAFADVAVSDPMPTLELPNDALVWSGSNYTLTPSYFDPAGDDPLEWIVDWGDKTSAEHYAGDARSFAHAFPDGGTEFDIALTAVTTSGLLTRSVPAIVSVNPSQPPPNDGLYLWQHGLSPEDSSATLYGCDPADWDGQPYENRTYQFDWGDGSSGSSTFANTSFLYHYYANDGQYLAKIADPARGTSAWVWATITDQYRPVIAPIAEQTVDIGDPVTITASYSGLGPGETAKAMIDWDDGRHFQPATVTGTTSGTVTATLDHAPAGPLNGTLIVYDGEGGFDQRPFFVDVIVPRVTLLRATDDADAARVAISPVVDGQTIGSITLSAPPTTGPNAGKAKLKIETETDPAGTVATWEVSGGGEPLQRGTDGGVVTLTPGVADRTYLVRAGVDRNADGDIDDRGEEDQRVTVAVPGPAVDLDVDSDNDAEDGEPSHSEAEDQLEADNAKGKWIAANTGDLDHDKVPDFADFNGVAGASFTPMVLRLPDLPGIAPGQIDLRFNYDDSDPAAARTGAGTAADPYVYAPAPGALRVWRKNGSAARPIAGNFIVGGTSYTAAELGIQPGGERTFYVEGVEGSTAALPIRVTATLKGSAVDTVLADEVHVAPIETQYVEFNADRTISRVEKVGLSNPAPVFSDIVVSAEEIRASADGSKLLGNLRLTGKLEDALSNVLPGEEGTITSVAVFLNGGEAAVATISFGSSEMKKSTGEPDPSPTAPSPWPHTLYEYSAEFDKTLGADDTLELQPGWNTVRLVARNAYGFSGHAEVSVEAIVEPPLDVHLELSGSTLTASYRNALGEWEPARLFSRSLDDDRRFEHRDLSNAVDGTITFAGLNPLSTIALDAFDVTIADPTFHLSEPVRVTETGLTSGIFEGTSADAEENWTGYGGGTRLSIGETTEPELSGPGELHVTGVEIVAPQSVLGNLGKIALGEGATAINYDAVTLGDRTLAGYINSTFQPATFIAAYDALKAKAEADYPSGVPAPNKPGTFADGAADGAIAPLIEMRDTAKAVGNGLVKAKNRVIDHPKEAAEWVNPVTASVKIGTKIGLFAVNNAGTAFKLAKKAVSVYQDTLPFLPDLLAEFVADPDAAVVGLMSGTSPALANMPSEVQTAFHVGAEVLDELLKAIDALPNAATPYNKGWYLGYGMMTVFVECATALATAGAANVLTLASKWAILTKVAPKFAKFGGVFKKAVKAIGFDDVGKVIAHTPGPNAPPLSKIETLLTTNVCFVAGTMVHTANGPVPIERIRAGDQVLSRDEATGDQTFKPVVDTVVTRPDALYTVTYDVDGPGPIPPAELLTTAPHPFYVANQVCFVPAAALRPGDNLVLADGTQADVASIDIRRAGTAGAFTTYNFEVAEYHTYFVGDAGVWVHNSGNFDCQKFASHVDWMMKKDGSTKRAAFEKALRLSNPDLHIPGTPGFDAAKRLVAKYDPHLAVAAREVMSDAYTRAVRGGAVDLSEVPTAKGLYEALGFERGVPGNASAWVNGRSSASALEVHHTATKKATTELLFKRFGLPIDNEVLDDMPGFLINARNASPLAGPRHQALTTALNNIPLSVNGVARSTAAIFDDMAGAYRAWDPQLGPNVWQVAEKWFNTKGIFR